MIIDPLDGTNSFTRGDVNAVTVLIGAFWGGWLLQCDWPKGPGFSCCEKVYMFLGGGMFICVCVCSGISVDGEPVAGVVHLPFVNRTVWGCEGIGNVGLMADPSPPCKQSLLCDTGSQLCFVLTISMCACFRLFPSILSAGASYLFGVSLLHLPHT